MENSYLFDWLSFTVPVRNFNDLTVRSVRSFLKELGLDFNFDTREKGAYGYTNSLSYANAINVLYNDLESLVTNSEDRLKQALDMGIHVEMTGQGCRYFEGLENNDCKKARSHYDPWAKLLRFYESYPQHDEFINNKCASSGCF